MSLVQIIYTHYSPSISLHSIFSIFTHYNQAGFTFSISWRTVGSIFVSCDFVFYSTLDTIGQKPSKRGKVTKED